MCMYVCVYVEVCENMFVMHMCASMHMFLKCVCLQLFCDAAIARSCQVSYAERP